MDTTARNGIPCCLVVVAALLAACDRSDTAPRPEPTASAGTTGAGTVEPDASPAPPATRPDDAAASPSFGDPHGPRITFERSLHDFGVVSDRQPTSTRFTFRNTGLQPLLITDVKSTCGCTVPTLEQRRFAPGEGSAIDVTFNPSGRAGPITKAVKLFVNAVQDPIELTINADVRPVMRVDTRIMRLGVLEFGREHRRRINMFFTDPELAITKLEAAHPDVTVQVLDPQPAGTVNGLPRYRMAAEVVLSAETPWGLLDPGTITLEARGRPWPDAEPYVGSYNVFVSAQLYGDLRPEPAAIVARGVTEFGRDIEATAVLSRASGGPLDVYDASILWCDQPELELRYERVDDSSWKLTVSGPLTRRGAFKGRVSVQTNVPGEEVLEVPITGFVK